MHRDTSGSVVRPLLILSIYLTKKSGGAYQCASLAEKKAECTCVCGCQSWQANLSQATPPSSSI